MTPSRSLDDLDVALLAALRDHPRAGSLELSRITGVARATVSARLQRLEDGRRRHRLRPGHRRRAPRASASRRS